MTTRTPSSALPQLRQLLAEYGKQDALAADFGVHKSTMSRWLSGHIRTLRKGHRDRIVELSARFEAQPRWLRAETDNTLADLGGGDDCDDDS